MPTIDKTGTMCAFAWSGIEIDAKGAVRPCCEYEGLLRDDCGREINVAESSLAEITNCRDLRDLREKMLAGDRPIQCQKCWIEQDNGKETTLRNFANSKIDLDSDNLTLDPGPLQHIGIALGNICNLRCRICGPWASSVWASDEIRRLGKERSQQEQIWLRQGAWPGKVKEFWNEFSHSTDVKILSFYGGEPFMSPDHLDILENFCATGSNARIDIKYSTNATVFPEKYISVLEKFKNINIAFSLDDIGKRFEYQRKNAIWNETIGIINRFLEIKHIRYSIICTVSVFNVLYLNEIIDEFTSRWPMVPIRFNVLRLSEFNSILYAPVEFKNAVKDHVSGRKYPEYVQPQIDQLVSLLYEHDSSSAHWNDLRREISKFDQFRNERLRDSHPELADFLGI